MLGVAARPRRGASRHTARKNEKDGREGAVMGDTSRSTVRFSGQELVWTSRSWTTKTVGAPGGGRGPVSLVRGGTDDLRIRAGDTEGKGMALKDCTLGEGR